MTKLRGAIKKASSVSRSNRSDAASSRTVKQPRTDTGRPRISFAGIDMGAMVHANVGRNIGCLSNYSKSVLNDENSAQRKQERVDLLVTVLRQYDTGKGTTFVLIADYTGHISVMVPSKSLDDLNGSDNSKGSKAVLVRIEGIITFRRSNNTTRGADQVFYAVRDGVKIEPITKDDKECCDPRTSFLGMLEVTKDPLATGATWPAIIGTVVHRQESENTNSIILALEDKTGYASLVINDCTDEKLSSIISNRPSMVLFIGSFDLRVAVLQGTSMVQAFVELEDIKIIEVSDQTINQVDSRYRSTLISDYTFPSPLLED